jgi:hypothetical protein
MIKNEKKFLITNNMTTLDNKTEVKETLNYNDLFRFIVCDEDRPCGNHFGRKFKCHEHMDASDDAKEERFTCECYAEEMNIQAKKCEFPECSRPAMCGQDMVWGSTSMAGNGITCELHKHLYYNQCMCSRDCSCPAVDGWYNQYGTLIKDLYGDGDGDEDN